MSVTTGEAQEAEVKNGLEAGVDGELGELHFEFAKDV